MPSFGLGLSLGSSQPKKMFDADASIYITQNNISNSQVIRNYNSGRSILSNAGGASSYCFSTNNQASLGASSPFVTTSSKSWTIGFWISPQQFVNNTNSQSLFGKNMGSDGLFEWDSSLYAVDENLYSLYFRVSTNNTWANIDNWNAIFSNDSFTNGLNPMFSNKKTLVFFEWNGPTLTRKIIFNSGGNSETIAQRVLATAPSYSNYGELNFLRHNNSKQSTFDELCAWSRVLTASERAEIFNLGDGKKYSELSSSIKTDLVSWWSCDEISGNRADSHGSNTFVVNGSVGSAQPLIGVEEYVNPQFLINKFIVDCKTFGFWNNGVFYPLRKGFAGTNGATLYPFGGYNVNYNGTLVHDPSGTHSSNGTSTSFSNYPTQFTSSGMLFYSTFATSENQQIGLRINLPNSCIPTGISAISLFSVAMPFWKEACGVRTTNQTSNTRQKFISTGDGNTSTDSADIGIASTNDGDANASWNGNIQKSITNKPSQLIPRFDFSNITSSPSVEYYQNASLVGTDTTLQAGYSRTGFQNRIGCAGTSAGAFAGVNGYLPVVGFFNKTLTSTEITNLYNSLKSSLAYGFNLP